VELYHHSSILLHGVMLRYRENVTSFMQFPQSVRSECILCKVHFVMIFKYTVGRRHRMP